MEELYPQSKINLTDAFTHSLQYSPGGPGGWQYHLAAGAQIRQDGSSKNSEYFGNTGMVVRQISHEFDTRDNMEVRY